LDGYNIKQLEELEFEHFTVNHNFNFVDPEVGIHNQHVEGM
jgi:hypothetical protein